MKMVGIYEAKMRFSALVKEAASGERIAITSRGEVIAEIGPPARAGVDAIEWLLANDIPLGVSARDAIEWGRH